MDMGLQNKVAIVTGGSLGIGRATAMVLAEEGVDMAICARGMEALEEAASDIRSKTGRKVVPIRADMTVPEDIKSMVATAVAEFGGVDILVNNAVNSRAALFMELEDADWMNHITTKVMGYIRCAREIIPHMQRRGGGRIINIGGSAARGVSDRAMSNGITNSGVSNLAKNLSDQFAKDGILVNCIHPGATRTPRLVGNWESLQRDTGVPVEQTERNTAANIPIGRLIGPEEIAYMILFLCSNKADAITGQTIAIDGGAARGIFY
jgi:NAD(P)-dependent dehydrogenase (short-subunit alcohol dehydrogenase family)